VETLGVLIVDDEKNIRHTLRVCLEAMGAKAGEAATAHDAVEAMRRDTYDVAFVDLKLGTESGLDVIPRLLAENPNLVVVVVTAYGTIETAVEAMRRGAWDYLPKPFSPAQIRHLVDRMQKQRALAAHAANLESQIGAEIPDVLLASSAPAVRAVLDTVARAAQADAAVLFRGESGTGKGVLARLLHQQSKRQGRPFMLVNCPTLSEDLLASELFGHVKGAFTGAVRDQIGRVEAADGGTLFLDEIGELPGPLQAKLLRFVQEKQFERIGENRTRRTDVRVVTATNRDLDDDVKHGRFREDLLYRLNVVEVKVPSLRERREDILPLARHFLGFFARAVGRAVPELSPAAERALAGYAWPGNVRELRNAIERAIILWPAARLEPQAFPERIAGARERGPFVGGDFTVEDVEREHILAVMARASSLDEAAAILGIDASTLWRKRKRYEEKG
jgi:two-component system, NtrC family, response regulator AlgB